MKNLKNLRNIGIMAHIDAGKTTTTERILFHTGKVHKIGEVHDGEAQMDWMAQEQERGITITSAATNTKWHDYDVSIIDTPGHVDFTVEVERSLRVLDGAVTVIDGQAGVEPQTETVWRQATLYNVPRIFFVNKMDKVGADFDFSLSTIKDRLGAKAEAVHVPIGKEFDFKGFIDVIDRKCYIFDQNPEEKYTIEEIPDDLKDVVESKRITLLETISEYDDKLMENLLNSVEPSIKEIKMVLRKATVTGGFHPVFCGSAYKNVGVKKLLDAVVDYLPSPLDVPPIEGTDLEGNIIKRIPSNEQPFSALAFKIMVDPFVGKLTFIRIYSGVMKTSSYIYNTTKDTKERVGRILQMHANSRKEIQEASTGDIVALVGLKNTTTGDTLSFENSKVILESMDFPEPVISLAVEPKTKKDADKLSLSLQKLSEEDPTFKTWLDQETSQTIIAGMGELHLEIIVDRIKREFNVEVNVGKPQVSYRETITASAEIESKFIRQTGGRGQYGHVFIKFEPNKNKGFEFASKIVGGKIPKEYFKAIRNGIEETANGGILVGYPLIDFKATLYDGSYHDVDSSEVAFKVAASKALQDAKTKCEAILLEPIMSVEVTTPSDYFGDIMGDLSSRRGQISGQEERGNAQVIKSEVPLSEMFGYATKLRSMSQGRAIYTMQFEKYQPTPKSIVEEILNKK